jgi:hypothetical protein
MPREATLDRRDETQRARATGDDNAHQCRTPVALGAERSVPPVKGGIACSALLAGRNVEVVM